MHPGIGGSVTGGNALDGDIPLVRFYDSSLTDAEVTSLFKSSILSYSKEVFAGYSINQPAAFAKAINSYEFVGDSSSNSVKDFVTGKTFTFRGNPEFRTEMVNGCPAASLVEITVRWGWVLRLSACAGAIALLCCQQLLLI